MMGGWAYMLRCSDQSYYVGSTSYENVGMRVDEHNTAKYIGYTAARRPVVLVWSKWFDDLRDAHVTERRLKGWSRAKKEVLIVGDAEKLNLLSRRRAGKSKEKPRLSKRELAKQFSLIGSRNPEAQAEQAPKDAYRVTGPRHPEVPSEASPEG
jgi:putative endonuclease